MRKDQRCLEIFRAFPAFLPRLLKTRSRRMPEFLLIHAICSRLAEVTLLALLTLPERRFSPFGRAGCSIPKSRFFSCSRRTMILKKFSAYLFALDTQNSRGI